MQYTLKEMKTSHRVFPCCKVSMIFITYKNKIPYFIIESGPRLHTEKKNEKSGKDE